MTIQTALFQDCTDIQNILKAFTFYFLFQLFYFTLYDNYFIVTCIKEKTNHKTTEDDEK